MSNAYVVFLPEVLDVQKRAAPGNNSSMCMTTAERLAKTVPLDPSSHVLDGGRLLGLEMMQPVGTATVPCVQSAFVNPQQQFADGVALEGNTAGDDINRVTLASSVRPLDADAFVNQSAAYVDNDELRRYDPQCPLAEAAWNLNARAYPMPCPAMSIDDLRSVIGGIDYNQCT